MPWQQCLKLAAATASTDEVAIAVTALAGLCPAGLMVLHDPAVAALLFLPQQAPRLLTLEEAARWTTCLPSTRVMLYTEAHVDMPGHYVACVPSRSSRTRVPASCVCPDFRQTAKAHPCPMSGGMLTGQSVPRHTTSLPESPVSIPPKQKSPSGAMLHEHVNPVVGCWGSPCKSSRSRSCHRLRSESDSSSAAVHSVATTLLDSPSTPRSPQSPGLIGHHACRPCAPGAPVAETSSRPDSKCFLGLSHLALAEDDAIGALVCTQELSPSRWPIIDFPAATRDSPAQVSMQGEASASENATATTLAFSYVLCPDLHPTPASGPPYASLPSAADVSAEEKSNAAGRDVGSSCAEKIRSPTQSASRSLAVPVWAPSQASSILCSSATPSESLPRRSLAQQREPLSFFLDRAFGLQHPRSITPQMSSGAFVPMAPPPVPDTGSIHAALLQVGVSPEVAAAAVRQHPADINAALDWACAPATCSLGASGSALGTIDVDADAALSPPAPSTPVADHVPARSSMPALTRDPPAAASFPSLRVNIIVQGRSAALFVVDEPTCGAVLHALAVSLFPAASGRPHLRLTHEASGTLVPNHAREPFRFATWTSCPL